MRAWLQLTLGGPLALAADAIGPADAAGAPPNPLDGIDGLQDLHGLSSARRELQEVLDTASTNASGS